jgi:glutathione S-transferase
VYRTFFLAGQRFIGGDTPSIADIRLAATIEFLHAVDYELPTWLADYMATMEATLGDAYTEPATDVRGYIDYVRSQAG